ncbi:MAG: ATP phosphoribosyltransferase, partial [Candidatus Omnitrophota bacterium]
TETGSSLKANNLRIVDTICTSVTQLIANKAAYKNKWKREKIDNIALLLKGAIQAESKVGLKMNVIKRDLKKVINILPALKKPTVAPLYHRSGNKEDWFDVDTILEEKVVRVIIPKLKKAGAQGIVEYPLNKVIY